MQQGMQLIRVTGMDGAKAYQMPPNSVVPLFDADNDIMYVKSTDGAGFPTIRAFAFQPIENPTPQTQQYVTREEFNDTITGNRMADMQNQINQLQLSQAMCGVVRYPNTFAYNAGPSPFCGNGCCGTANI